MVDNVQTSVISYYIARPSRDIVIAGRQETTREVWARGISMPGDMLSGRAVRRIPMKDPIVEEIRKYRQEHAVRFEFDLAKICADLRQIQQTCGRPVVKFKPKPLQPAGSAQTELKTDNQAVG